MNTKNTKKIYVLGLLSLLATTPSASAGSSTKNIQRTIGVLVGAGNGITSFANMKLIQWIADECAKKTTACNVNYIPAIAAGAILETTSTVFWQKILSYLASDPEYAGIFYGLTNLCAIPAVISFKLSNLAVFFCLRATSFALLLATDKHPKLIVKQPEVTDSSAIQQEITAKVII